MRDYGNHTGIPQASEDICGVLEDEHVRELHQQIAFLVDGVLGGVVDGVLDVVVGKVEIAPGPQLDFARHGRPQLFSPLPNDIGLEFVFEIGMRRGDNAAGTTVGRHFQHRHAILKGLGTVVHAPEDVAMDIDQINISSS